MKIPPNAQKTCAGLNCPERFSLCCNEGCTIKGDGFYRCKGCSQIFVGGKCTAGESNSSDREKMPKKIDVDSMREFPDNRTDENITLARKINEVIDFLSAPTTPSSGEVKHTDEELDSAMIDAELRDDFFTPTTNGEGWEHLKKDEAVSELIKHVETQAREEERQFILNILDGVDKADKEIGNKGGGTKAIRLALKNRII